MVRLAAALFCLANSFAIASTEGWTFTESFAVKLPTGWKILSDSKLEGVGHEVLTGPTPAEYVRIFVSGDKLDTQEFRARMEAVVKEAKAPGGKKLLRPASVDAFQKKGAIMRLVFRSKIKGKDYFEAHYPLAIGGRGADLHYAAPLARLDAGLKDLEALVASFRPTWVAPPHELRSGK